MGNQSLGNPDTHHYSSPPVSPAKSFLLLPLFLDITDNSFKGGVPAPPPPPLSALVQLHVLQDLVQVVLILVLYFLFWSFQST